MPRRPRRPCLAGVIGWLLVVWVWAAIAPLNRHDWLLENLLVFVYAGVLILTYRRFAFSNLSYGLFAAFITLHLIGAHYTYSAVPLGAWVKDWLGLSRNHFDRLAHFSYGLLLVYAFREALLRLVGIPLGWAAFVAVSMVLAFSAFFEIVETVVAIIVSPELGDAYLGTQGDIWDAQKDMGLALIGAIIALGFILKWERRRGFTSAHE